MPHPTSGAKSPGSAQHSQALDLKRPLGTRAASSFRRIPTRAFAAEIPSYRPDFAASQQDTFRVPGFGGAACASVPVSPMCADLRSLCQRSQRYPDKARTARLAQAWTKLANQAEKNSRFVHEAPVQHPEPAHLKALFAAMPAYPCHFS